MAIANLSAIAITVEGRVDETFPKDRSSVSAVYLCKPGSISNVNHESSEKSRPTSL